MLLSSPYLVLQIAANLILFLSTNLLGTMSFFFYERQQRRAFLETRKSLEVKLVLEEESQEQVLNSYFLQVSK
jgi:adenylate cyclase 3